MSGTVLILGASGKIGRNTAEAFWNAGWRVRLYDRTAGDMAAQAHGADVIVNGLNPPNYHNWATLIPAITNEVIAAARESGASVILPGNVYNFGDTPGTWDESTPQRPVSRKGRIRKEMEETYAASGVQTIVLRAGNFIEPGGRDDMMAMLYCRTLPKGKLTLPGGRDVVQAFCYLPDWARAAVMLAERRETLAQFEDIPFEGHAFTFDDLHSTLEAETGRKLQVTAFPWAIMSLLSPVMELARELREMRYLWDTPHRLSGEKLTRLLPEFHATPLDEVLRAPLERQVDPDQRVARGGQPILAKELA